MMSFLAGTGTLKNTKKKESFLIKSEFIVYRKLVVLKEIFSLKNNGHWLERKFKKKRR